MSLQLPIHSLEIENVLPGSLLRQKLSGAISMMKYLLRPLLILLDVINRRLSQIIVMRLPLMHSINVFVFVSLLIKYIPVYSRFYAVLRLPATLAMNLLLFGLADCLAQTIVRFFSGNRPISIPPTISNAPSYSDAGESEIQVLEDYGDGEEYANSSAPASGRVLGQINIAPTTDDIEALASSATSSITFDYERLMGFMLWGFFISFPQFFWYMILNGLYVDDPKFITVLERVLADQLFYLPLSLAGFFYYSSVVLEHGDKNTFKAKMKKVYISTLAANYCLWPAVQFINFLAMPKAYQVPFSSSVGVLWNCFLSMRNAQAK